VRPVRPGRVVSALLLALAVLALGSCGRMVVLAAEPWWSAVSAGSREAGREVALAALRRGYLPSFVSAGLREDPKDRLLTALSRRRAAAVVVGPPLSLDAAPYAGRFPDVTFVLVGGPPADDGIPNTVQLVYDRRAAFRAAGTLAARAGRVAVLSAPGRAEEETAAFEQAVLTAPGAVAPLDVSVGESPDPQALESAVGKLRADGVSVFLYRPTVSGAAFLDVLAAAGGVAVVEDWAASRPRPRQVLASIEEDLPSGIRACLAPGAAPVVTVAATLVRGAAPVAAPGPGGAR
jgi:hypothetical protein